jgi:ketosteroid isomerase-like protein
MSGRTTDAGTESLLAANSAFYAAFEQRDLDAMSDVWLHADHVTCTHPGWTTLHGWAAVSASWFALFQGDRAMQFILTEVHVTIVGDAGWVSLDENLIAGALPQTVAALNVFQRVGGVWKLVVHHGSGVAPT